MEGRLHELATNKVDIDMNNEGDTVEERLNELATNEVDSGMVTDGYCTVPIPHGTEHLYIIVHRKSGSNDDGWCNKTTNSVATPNHTTIQNIC